MLLYKQTFILAWNKVYKITITVDVSRLAFIKVTFLKLIITRNMLNKIIMFWLAYDYHSTLCKKMWHVRNSIMCTYIIYNNITIF